MCVEFPITLPFLTVRPCRKILAGTTQYKQRNRDSVHVIKMCENDQTGRESTQIQTSCRRDKTFQLSRYNCPFDAWTPLGTSLSAVNLLPKPLHLRVSRPSLSFPTNVSPGVRLLPWVAWRTRLVPLPCSIIFIFMYRHLSYKWRGDLLQKATHGLVHTHMGWSWTDPLISCWEIVELRLRDEQVIPHVEVTMDVDYETVVAIDEIQFKAARLMWRNVCLGQ